MQGHCDSGGRTGCVARNLKVGDVRLITDVAQPSWCRSPPRRLRQGLRFEVIVAPPDTDELITLRKAAVLGDGGGNDTGPPIRGVRPVPGVSPVRGVRPV